MIAEQASDIQIKYLYVKKFKWLDAYEKEAFAGHPISNRIYKTLYNKNTGHYKLIVDKVLLVFDKLQNNNEKYESDLAEITLNTILDFQISPEDLDNLHNWLVGSDIKPEPHPIVILQEAMLQQQDEESEFAGRASNLLMNLYITDSIKAEIVLQYIEYLLNETQTEHEDPANHIKYDKKSGGLNIATALRAIGKYSSTDRRINGEISDLVEAVGAITTEIERKILHQID